MYILRNFDLRSSCNSSAPWSRAFVLVRSGKNDGIAVGGGEGDVVGYRGRSFLATGSIAGFAVEGFLADWLSLSLESSESESELSELAPDDEDSAEDDAGCADGSAGSSSLELSSDDTEYEAARLLRFLECPLARADACADDSACATILGGSILIDLKKTVNILHSELPELSNVA